ncbi:MAG: MerR family transcriptional regulator [Sedimentisphaerales bacterium]|nr:MerR family transcriptional regulator [Sedimentisphaerales bacterium]MBN2841726.1 MerR family transcriptional regulator [Sedimentisphaerales bacterium]
MDRYGEVVLSEQTLAERLRTNPPVKLFKIGEVARYSGLSRQTVHNYTIMGLIEESGWTDGGHRLYPEEVFEKLARIDALKQSCTLQEIRKMLAGEPVSQVRCQ